MIRSLGRDRSVTAPVPCDLTAKPTRCDARRDTPESKAGGDEMRRIRLTDPAQLRSLPDGARLTIPGVEQPLLWLHAYTRPHQDPETGLWQLPRNPFTEHHVTELDADLPDPQQPTAVLGDEEWLTTLEDPHDASAPHL